MEQKKSQRNSGRAHIGVVLFMVITAVSLYFVLGNPPPPNTIYGPEANLNESAQNTNQQEHSLQIRALGTITPTPLQFSQTQQPISSTAGPCNGKRCCADDVAVPQPDDCNCPDITVMCGSNSTVNAAGNQADCSSNPPEVDCSFVCWGGNPLTQTGNTNSNPFNQAPILQRPPGYGGGEVIFQGFESQGGPGKYCYGKPVIYLYPTKPEIVSVTLKIPGIIYKSIPQYPQSGWQNILAEPDGTLKYQNKNYKELYYESQVNVKPTVTNGIIIPKNELQSSLSKILIQLGLKQTEQQEFLQYWMPKLEPLSGNYILFSVLNPNDKDRVDHVEISPKPDTSIEFLAYFKPLEFPISVDPLNLPANPPQRTGFTAVEWGGTIDNNVNLFQ